MLEYLLPRKATLIVLSSVALSVFSKLVLIANAQNANSSYLPQLGTREHSDSQGNMLALEPSTTPNPGWLFHHNVSQCVDPTGEVSVADQGSFGPPEDITYKQPHCSGEAAFFTVWPFNGTAVNENITACLRGILKVVNKQLCPDEGMSPLDIAGAVAIVLIACLIFVVCSLAAICSTRNSNSGERMPLLDQQQPAGGSCHGTNASGAPQNEESNTYPDLPQYQINDDATCSSDNERDHGLRQSV